MIVTPLRMKAPFGLLMALALTAGLGACASEPQSAAAPAPAPVAAAPAPTPAMPMAAMKHGQGHAMAAHHGMAKPAPSPHAEAIQTALNANGAKLAVDGLMGRKTHAALAAYQKAHGMKATGMPDAKTLAALGVKG